MNSRVDNFINELGSLSKKTVKWFSRNRLITILFLFSTLFFLYQHTTGYSWDFSAYVMNAKYMFADGYYFELLRAPLAPVLIFLFSFFGWLAAEYLYILFVSVLFLFSAMKFAENYKVDKTAFYVFSMTFFTIIWSFSVGTELLSLALFLLFLAYLHKKRSGIFFGLMTLVRYTNFSYVILFLFQKNWKKIILSIIIFALVLSPWLLYNWYYTGSPLTSIANSYALNVMYRSQMLLENPFKIEDVLYVMNFAIPFFLLGLFKKLKKLDRNDIMMLLIFFLTLFLYINTPSKEPRYLFNLIIPSAYFAAICLNKIRLKGLILTGFVIVNLLVVIALIPVIGLENPSVFKTAISKLDDCATKSNVWVPISYYGHASEPYPHASLIDEAIDDGYRLLLFRYVIDPEYAGNASFLEQFPIIENATTFVILGDPDKCKPIEKVDKNYLDHKNEYVYAEEGYHIDTDPCNVLLSKELCDMFRFSK